MGLATRPRRTRRAWSPRRRRRRSRIAAPSPPSRPTSRRHRSSAWVRRHRRRPSSPRSWRSRRPGHRAPAGVAAAPAARPRPPHRHPASLIAPSAGAPARRVRPRQRAAAVLRRRASRSESMSRHLSRLINVRPRSRGHLRRRRRRLAARARLRTRACRPGRVARRPVRPVDRRDHGEPHRTPSHGAHHQRIAWPRALRFREGDTVTLRVRNQLDETTSIDWHGLILPANMDGVPG